MTEQEIVDAIARSLSAAAVIGPKETTPQAATYLSIPVFIAPIYEGAAVDTEALERIAQLVHTLLAHGMSEHTLTARLLGDEDVWGVTKA